MHDPWLFLLSPPSSPSTNIFLPLACIYTEYTHFTNGRLIAPPRHVYRLRYCQLTPSHLNRQPNRFLRGKVSQSDFYTPSSDPRILIIFSGTILDRYICTCPDMLQRSVYEILPIQVPTKAPSPPSLLAIDLHSQHLENLSA